MFEDAKGSQINEAEMLEKFDQLGLIGENEIALVLAAKMSEKRRDNSIFIIKDGDQNRLFNCIENLILNGDLNSVTKFQIIYKDGSHYIFGEFVVDKTKNPITAKYFHCDPAGSMTLSDAVLNDAGILQISNVANIEIYSTNLVIQKGIGCSYFSIDCCLMLSAPANPDYMIDLYDYMNKNACDSSISDNGKVKNILSLNLPLRLIRGMQVYETVQRSSIFGSKPAPFKGYDLHLMLCGASDFPTEEELSKLEKVPLLIKVESTMSEAKCSFYIYGESKEGKNRLIELKPNEELDKLDFNNNQRVYISTATNSKIYEEITLQEGHTQLRRYPLKDRIQYPLHNDTLPVNKKGESAKISVEKYIIKKEEKDLNMRVHKERENYKVSVEKFLHNNKSITYDKLDDYKITGLEKFCNHQIAKKLNPKQNP